MASETGPARPTTTQELRDHPAVYVWHTVEPSYAGALHIGRTTAFEQVRRGEVPSIRIGKRVMVPSSYVLALLGADHGRDGAA